MNKKTIKDIDVYDKKVLVRVDFNVPVIDGKITVNALFNDYESDESELEYSL